MKNQMVTTAMLNEDEFLEHFGKKGMKWGIKKDTPTNPSHVSADAARYNKIGARSKKNGLDNLSNDDLAKLNKRNQLLSQYAKDHPTTLKKGQEASKKALTALKVAGTLVTVGVALAGAAKSPSVKAGAMAVVKIVNGLK